MQPRAPFIIAGLLIGTLFTLQLQSDIASDSSYPLDEYEFQHQLLTSFVDDQRSLETQLSELRVEVEAAEMNVSDLYSSIDSDYVQELKASLGLTEVTGGGVEIVLDDSPAVTRDSVVIETNALVHAADLRDIVNLLRTFPFTGLSINGQRIVAISSIRSAGTTILINNLIVVPPFKIEILTDVPDLVIQSLSHEAELPSIYERIVQNGLEFKFKKVEEVTLRAYTGGYPTNTLTIITSASDVE